MNLDVSIPRGGTPVRTTHEEGVWQFWVDRGGTFTDIVALRPDGSLLVHKLLSQDPGHYDDAVLHGIRRILGLKAHERLPLDTIGVVKMGTTIATNALLERTGEPTLLLVTQGFRDGVRIGYQNRPDIFSLNIRLPKPLYARVEEIPERLDAHGREVMRLDLATARTILQRAFDDGLRAVAIAFVHAYRYPQHEVRVAEIARSLGFTQVSVSHEVSPLVRWIDRTETTVVDAYLSPVLRRHLASLKRELRDSRLFFMQSSGGLVDADLFRGKNAVLSGPAGGIVGAVHTARAAGFAKIISFDMGGTSTDVARFSGDYERTFESSVGGVHLRAPMLRITTVAAGGGSLCRLEDGRLRVGPDSAGSDPGPACYRRGGPLTVTDCSVLVGKIQPGFFPNVFGPHGDDSIDVEIVREKLGELALEVTKTSVTDSPSRTWSAEQLADSFIGIAVDNMARAIKQISTERGYDVRNYTLCCFGGAGGQHACLVANALEVQRVFIPSYAGVLSAYGMGLADLCALRERTVEIVLVQERLPMLERAFDELTVSATRELAQQGVDARHVSLQCRLHVKYEGADDTLDVPWCADAAAMRADFEREHFRRYGFSMEDRTQIVEMISVEARSIADGMLAVVSKQPVLSPHASRSDRPVPLTSIGLFTTGMTCDAPVFSHNALSAGCQIIGPAVIVAATTTIVVEPGWQAASSEQGDLLLSRVASPVRRVIRKPSSKPWSAPDPMLLEVFNNRFMSIAEQMGGTLANTAHSVNIKERLDFSCALFDGGGQLVANAPHIPVHLGSMGETVAAVIRDRGQTMRPGDAYLLNSPYHGGTHLPDLTVVTPVFVDRQSQIILTPEESASGQPVFFVASRGHHADIGGITPGSMPPRSHTIHEEGVLIEDCALMRDGHFFEGEVVALLRAGQWPARNIDQNLADLRAQVAANARGVKELIVAVKEWGLDNVTMYMQHVQANAARAVSEALGAVHNGSFAYVMDNGGTIRVRVQVDRQAKRAIIDFTGTSPQRADNFNAPAAVCMAAVLYVFRTLVKRDIPLNAGCLQPLKIFIPEGSMLSPRYPAAVAAGNVETSQAIVDALYGALGTVAASQGTMNNVTFGNESFQYYETICGGAGAGPDYDGCSAVHTHMTNSRLTDPEVLELRFPVRVDEFAIRLGTGGAGRHEGGDGVLRRLHFLAPTTVAVLSNRRVIPPFGLRGGHPGSTGRNVLERLGGEREDLGGVAEVRVDAGDVIIIETPGGGGYGKLDD
jgi:5-oxoprolinase (ATP-hydrolysing)